MRLDEELRVMKVSSQNMALYASQLCAAELAKAHLLVGFELGAEVIDFRYQLLLGSLSICNILQSSVLRFSHPA